MTHIWRFLVSRNDSNKSCYLDTQWMELLHFKTLLFHLFIIQGISLSRSKHYKMWNYLRLFFTNVILCWCSTCVFTSVFVTIRDQWKSFARIRFAGIKDMWCLGKQTPHFVLIGWEFWEILMCRRTACSTSKDSLFSTSFTGCPSTVTFYEVQLQLLLLHQRHNFQKWCRNSRLVGSWSGWYYPLEGGGINPACLEEQKPVSGCGEVFVVMYLFIYISSFFPPVPFPKTPLTFISRVLQSSKLHQKTSKTKSKNIFRQNMK